MSSTIDMDAKIGTVVGFSYPPKEVHVRVEDPAVLQLCGLSEFPRVTHTSAITDQELWDRLQIGSKVSLNELNSQY